LQCDIDNDYEAVQSRLGVDQYSNAQLTALDQHAVSSGQPERKL